MGRNLTFAFGTALVVLGTFDLFVGLTHPGLGEDAFASIAQSFMLLFPGSVFVAYALQHSPRLSSLSPVVSRAVGDSITSVDVATASESAVVVAFPVRGGNGSRGAPAIRAHGK